MKETSLRVLSIGDCMAIISPDNFGTFDKEAVLRRDLAGAEMNFLMGCSSLGLHATLISEFGKDSLGKVLTARLKQAGVKLDGVVYANLPTPLMLKEYDADRNPRSHYYRIGTAGSCINKDRLKLSLFTGLDYFHFTGIFPALSERNYETLNEAINIAKREGALIGFDPNIRPALFRDEEEIRLLLTPFLRKCDLFLGGLNEARLLLQDKKMSPLQVAKELHRRGIDRVALKMGAEGAYASAEGGEKWLKQKPFPVKNLADATGAGDAFAAAYIYALLNDWSAADSLSFASWMGARIVGDPSDNLGFPKLSEALEAWELAKKHN